MKRLHLVFAHGWGFGPAFWDPLRAELTEYPSAVLDLGFFGPERLDAPAASPDAALVAVGHSLGVPWLLGQDRFTFEALVSLGGFGRFDVPAGPVRAMRRGLARNAGKVLADFRLACGLSPHDAPDISGARPDRLAEGLDWLLSLDERPALEAFVSAGRPLLAVAARDDAVVPETLSRASFPKGLAMLPGGGHAFPATRATECATLIRAFLVSLGVSLGESL